MIPKRLSSDLLSLRPGRNRLALTLTAHLDDDLDIAQMSFRPTILRSSYQYEYADIDAILRDRRHPKYKEISGFYAFALDLRGKRGETSAGKDHEVVKKVIEAEEDLRPVTPLSARPGYRGQIMVEEFMVLTNKTASDFLSVRGADALYISHKNARYTNIRQTLKGELLRFNGNGGIDKKAISEMLTGALGRARYTPVPSYHEGLDTSVYGHFTSPIRRFSDIVNHRILHAALSDLEPPFARHNLHAIGTHLNMMRDEIRVEENGYIQNLLHSIASELGLAEAFLKAKEASPQRLVFEGRRKARGIFNNPY